MSQSRSVKDLSVAFLEIINNGDYDGLYDVLAHDVVTEWPQSRERVVGVDKLRHILEDYPGGLIRATEESTRFVEGDDERFLLTPMFTMVRAEGVGGETAVSTHRTRYPDGSDWYIVTIAKARDGKIVHLRQFFAPVYDAPEWREHLVEPMRPDE